MKRRKPTPQAPYQSGIRPPGYFTSGKLYLIQLDGTIIDIQISYSDPEEDFFYYKTGSDGTAKCKRNSPAIISAAELLWIQTVLKNYPRTKPMPLLVSETQTGNTNAVILIYFLTSVISLYKSSTGYHSGFTERLLDSLHQVEFRLTIR